jgi:NADH:ubiquinone oxidoreductase subunit E
MHTHRAYNFKNQHFVGEEGRLIPLLQQAQAEDGYLRRERLQEIHEVSGIPLAQIYGVATFYAQFRLKPVGKFLLRVCHGTACHVSGAVELSQAVEKHLGVPNGETTPDRMFSIETVSCLGCCSLAPAMMINAATFGNLSPSAAVKVVKKFQKGERS